MLEMMGLKSTILRRCQERNREEGLKHRFNNTLLMEFFLDTADVDEIREIASWGILDGVTTIHR